MTRFPDAWYLVLSSRLIPGLDGGYTVATLTRIRQMREAGAETELLTVDPGAPEAHVEHRSEFVRRGMLDVPERLRNLFDEASDPRGGGAQWLREATAPGDADPSLSYREVTDAAGRPIVSLPVITGDPDWHLTTAPIVVHDADGSGIGVIAGFGSLYRAWLDHVVAGLRERVERPVVVICESRQLGELLSGWHAPAVRLLHTVHTTHLEPPFTPDAPLNALWSRWFSVADRFDAVLWPTPSQRDDVVERFGSSGVHAVVPNAVVPPASVVPIAAREPSRAVVIGRLAPGKRVDLAIRGFVGAAVPDATLDIYGDGAERGALQALIDDLGVGESVVLRGATEDVAGVLDAASVYLSTSAFEGQGLALAEALSHGTPAVVFDIRYGPRDMLRDGGGVLVPDGDVAALSAALTEVLGDAAMRERLSAEALVAAARFAPAPTMDALAAVARQALDRTPRRSPGTR
ncbi:glycosyltransferase [Microbacterium sp. A1-JK]|uniref:glycosyltransferase n=1 Tax=Microbacterium sp. A1-JK TaxID=3177516 RepID=UPI00388B928C